MATARRCRTPRRDPASERRGQQRLRPRFIGFGRRADRCHGRYTFTGPFGPGNASLAHSVCRRRIVGREVFARGLLRLAVQRECISATGWRERERSAADPIDDRRRRETLIAARMPGAKRRAGVPLRHRPAGKGETAFFETVTAADRAPTARATAAMRWRRILSRCPNGCAPGRR